MKTTRTNLFNPGLQSASHRPPFGPVSFKKSRQYFFLSFFLLIFSLPAGAQALWDVDAHPPGDTVQVRGQSYYGRPHTPRGDLKMLVLTIGFDRWDYEGDSLCVFSSNSEVWPVHSGNGNDYQGLPEYFDEAYYSSPDMFSPTASDLSVSNFYYQQSRTGEQEPFKVTYQFFPHRINVPILPSDRSTNFYDFINRAYDTIQSRFADDSWYQYFTQFDQRTNSNNQFDNSVNPTPDGNIDYLLILFRFSSPPSGNEELKWMNIGHSAYSSVLGRTINFPQGKTISFNKGFTVQKGIRDRNGYVNVCIHEDGHVFYNGPHVFNANSVVGKYFYTGSGWGGVLSGPRVYYSYNAWDRWWLNWIDIKHDLSGPEHNGDYWLKDFITTGDAMRLKLPTPDGQYVWLENRTGHTPFDERLGLTVDGDDNPIPQASKGVVGFVETISDNRESVSIFGKGANALRVINPNGNFDYAWTTYREKENAPEWWGNRIYDFTTVQANPFSPHNSLMALRDDFFGDSTHFLPNGVIAYDPDSNSPNNQKREQYSVIEQNGEVIWGQTGYNLAFAPGSKFSICTNPGLIAQQKYIGGDAKLDPIYLHGLSFQVLQYSGSGVNRKAQIRVKFDDYEIDRDVRWTGEIILSADVPLELKESKIITLDKSGTPNRHTLTTAGDFINPTTLTLEPSSKFTLGASSRMIVENGSTLTLESGSKLKVSENAKLIVKAGTRLAINDCSEIEVLPGGKIVVEAGGILQISPNAILNAHNGQGSFTIHPNAIIPAGFVHPNDVVPPTYRITGSPQVWDNPTYKMHCDLVVETGAKLTLLNPSLSFSVGKGMQVNAGAELNIEGGTLLPRTDCNYTGGWGGITVKGNKTQPQTPTYQGKLTLNGTVVEKAITGIKVMGGGIVNVNGTTFLNNSVAISFGEYRYGTSINLSQVVGSTFTLTHGDPFGRKIIFIDLKGVARIKIAGNTFHNVSLPLNQGGHGIRALDADLFLRGDANTFIGLFTAIEANASLASPSFYVSDQVFENCFNGIRVSACPSPLIRGCSFQVPNYEYQGAVPTALSILNLNSFIVEGNTILGNGLGYGVYLESVIAGAGQVWANTIHGLSVGVMAKGITGPESIGTNTIQLQCNQFSNNSLSDILVSGVGLSAIQGTEEVSASNLFGTLRFHIISDIMPITYYGWNGSYTPTITEGRITVLEGRYLADCSVSIGPKDVRLKGISDADESLEMAENLLIEMQDMGLTDELLAQVDGASGNDPLALRDALMEKSPMLSDTVMVRTSDDEVPLPNIMLAQVLMSNPQAAKSSIVLDALEARGNALPPYLIEAILESGNTISPIDVVKSQVANHRAMRDMLAGSLTQRFVSDTLGKQYDSLQMLKDYHPDLIYQYLSAFATREMGDIAGAQQQLNDMGVNNALTPLQVQELNGVTTLTNLLDAAGEVPLASLVLDRTARATILGIADQGNGIASALAQNLLSAMDTIPFLAQAYVLDRNTGADAPTAHGPYVEVEPYPVTRFVVVHYDMGGTTTDNPYLSIKGQQGKTVYQQGLTRTQFELLVEVDGWLPGLYSVSLMDKEQTLARTSFVVEGPEQIEVDSNPLEDILAPIVSVYPNPTKGIVSIEVKGDREMLFSYEVFTQVGVRVLTGSGNGSKQLSLANLGRGSYMIAVNVNGTRHTFSVVVE